MAAKLAGAQKGGVPRFSVTLKGNVEKSWYENYWSSSIEVHWNQNIGATHPFVRPPIFVTILVISNGYIHSHLTWAAYDSGWVCPGSLYLMTNANRSGGSRAKQSRVTCKSERSPCIYILPNTDSNNAASFYDHPASILHKSIAGHYRPVSYPDGPITARYRFMKNAYWEWPSFHDLRTLQNLMSAIASSLTVTHTII